MGGGATLFVRQRWFAGRSRDQEKRKGELKDGPRASEILFFPPDLLISL
jgi:hypothetical protein